MFKDISWYEWLYSVDEFWNIFSYPKKWKHDGVILKSTNRNWYRAVTLVKNNIKNWFNIHRLVAITFIKNPQNKPQVNHINWIKSDNRLTNLEWCTVSENWIHSFNIIWNRSYNKWKYWFNSARWKTVLQYSLTNEFIKEWGSTREINRELWFSRTWISQCCLWNSKKSNWYIWKYK